MEGSEWCYNHDPARSEQRRRNASKGGRASGRGRPSPTNEVVELRQKLHQLAEDALNGCVEVNVAAVANQIYNTQLRALEVQRKIHEQEELEVRLAALEEARRGRSGGRNWGG